MVHGDSYREGVRGRSSSESHYSSGISGETKGLTHCWVLNAFCVGIPSHFRGASVKPQLKA